MLKMKVEERYRGWGIIMIFFKIKNKMLSVN